MAKELKAQSHYVNIMEALNRQRRTNDKHCDVTLMAEDKHFIAHRSILSASSVYFDTMFHSRMPEKFREVIEIKSVSKQAMQDVVDFIYTNHVSLSIDNVEEVLHGAYLMQIQDLIGLTIKYLSKKISLLNCLHFHQLGKLYSLEALLVKCKECILENFDEISIQTKFNDIKADDLGSLLSSDDMSVSSEEALYEALIRWVKHDLDTRKKHFPTLFQHLRLQLVSVDYLSKNIRKERLVRASLDCRDLVEDAFYFHVEPDMYEKEKLRIGKQNKIMFVPLSQKNVVVLNLKENSTTQLGVTGIYPGNSAVVVHDGKLYCFGLPPGEARVGCQPDTSVQCFDGAEWHTLQPMPQIRYHLFAACIKGESYVFGLGQQLDGSCNQFQISTYLYNALTNKWKLVGHNNTSIFRTKTTTAVVKDMAYRLGGYLQKFRENENNTDVCTVVELYNASTNQWTTSKNMNEARALCGAVCLNETIFAFGGFGIGNIPLSSAESMNVTTGVWTKLTIDVPYPLGETCACILKKHIAVYGSSSPGRIAMYTSAMMLQTFIENEKELISGSGRMLLV